MEVYSTFFFFTSVSFESLTLYPRQGLNHSHEHVSVLKITFITNVSHYSQLIYLALGHYTYLP